MPTPHHPSRGLRRVELATPRPEPVTEFYAALLGWIVIADPDGNTFAILENPTGWGGTWATHTT
ncbi:VOC family protein [Saccharothrix lopnurensis]|uniref:VOC family protein n=1 Tax=Saccharothrix lopnurensis TaxID=1670621 RepID=A0ABW1P2V6_9PSEU